MSSLPDDTEDQRFQVFQTLHLYKYREKLGDFIQATEELLLEFLINRGVLLPPDVAHLENTAPGEEHNFSQELIRIVAVRDQGYNTLLEGLKCENQLEAVFLLNDTLHEDYNKYCIEERTNSDADEDDDDNDTQTENNGEICSDGPIDHRSDGNSFAEIHSVSGLHSNISSSLCLCCKIKRYFKLSRATFTRFLRWARPPFQNFIQMCSNCCKAEITDSVEAVNYLNLRNEVGSSVVVPVIFTRVGHTPAFYSENNLIGRGSSGEVYRGFWDQNNNEVAVKVVSKKSGHLKKVELEISREIWATRSHKTTYIVPVMATHEDASDYFIVMELAVMSLEEAVTSNYCRINDNKNIAISLLRHCVDGLSWLHQDKNLIHRDIKPQNILLFRYDNGPVAKLADFGICRQEGADTRTDGSDHWMSPEALQALHDDQRFVNTQKIDIFSLGMVFYFCLNGGQHPFRVGDTLTSNIKNKQFLAPTLENADNHFQIAAANRLVQWMMQKEAEQRPTIAQIECHPMFWSEEKCLGFLEDVSRSLNNREECENVRAKINESFRNDFAGWKAAVDPRLFKRKRRGSGQKYYDEESIISLVELIRDKAEHFRDMVDDLKINLFGDKGVFSRKIYATYFLTRFPNIVIVLFCWLAKEAKREECLSTLRETYFGLFGDNM